MTSGSGVILELPVELNGIADIVEDDLKLEYAVMTDPNAVEIPVKNLGRVTPLPGVFTLEPELPESVQS